MNDPPLKGDRTRLIPRTHLTAPVAFQRRAPTWFGSLTTVYHIVYTLFMLTITIDRDLRDAVYAQVARQMRKLVATGALGPGTQLPSVRQLARDLGVSLNTIARAYRLLESEGFLVIRDRAGVTVAAPAEEIEDSAFGALVEELQVILARLRQAGMTNDELMQIMNTEVEAWTID